MSKWKMGIWYALIAAALFASGCEESGGGSLGDGQDFGSNDRNVYVALGDSITRGQGASIPYPAVLSSMLGKQVINKGVDGATAGDGLARVNGVLAAHRPGFLLILYGANDVIRGNPPDEVIEDLRGIIRRAKSNKTIPVLATVPPPIGPRAVFNAGVISLNVRIRSLAAEEGAALVEIEDAFAGNDDYFNFDGLHPNNTGHSVMAAEFFDALD